jgi:hypothetical protein
MAAWILASMALLLSFVSGVFSVHHYGQAMSISNPGVQYWDLNNKFHVKAESVDNMRVSVDDSVQMHRKKSLVFSLFSFVCFVLAVGMFVSASPIKI